MMRDTRGQIATASAMLVMILIVIAGALVDIYRLQEARDWAYRAAEAAALSGAADGRDFSTIYTIGQMRLDPITGYDVAQRTLDAEIARRGATGVIDQIETSEWGGDVFTDFPPVSRADLWNSDTWSPTTPSVGVYVELPVTTFLLGLTQQNTIRVHAFAAASVAQP
jgi:Flp pilus assembly protein TadG